MTGTPTELGLLCYLLNLLNLATNQLNAIFSTELGLSSDLIFLSLGGNYLTGTLPSELGLMTALMYLWLYSNNTLIGTLPRGMLSSLASLDLSWNQLID
jgi:Leucine-rich repeat (LRR) protein